MMERNASIAAWMDPGSWAPGMCGRVAACLRIGMERAACGQTGQTGLDGHSGHDIDGADGCFLNLPSNQTNCQEAIGAESATVGADIEPAKPSPGDSLSATHEGTLSTNLYTAMSAPTTRGIA